MKQEKQEQSEPLEQVLQDPQLGGFHREWSLIVNRWMRVLYTIFSRMKLPVTSMKVLLYLRIYQDNAEPSVIADSITVPRQTMTSILDGMEKDGWVMRHPHPSDRRKKCVQLTASGQTLADKILNRVRSHEAQAMLALSPEEVSDMILYMGKFSEAMERQVAGNSAVLVDCDLDEEGGRV